MSSASDNDKPCKGQNRGQGKRKRPQNCNRSMRRLALRCSSSSSCSSTAHSQDKSEGRLTLQTIYGGTPRRMQRCLAMPSKMAAKRYCLMSQPSDLGLTLAGALGQKPYLGDETPEPSKRFGPLKQEERPSKRRKSGKSQQSSNQPESITASDAVRPAKAPRKARLERLYQKGPLLGKGGYGSVFAAVRKSDGLPVAIKFVSKLQAEEEIKLPEFEDPLPMEVALMKRVCTAPESPHVLHMLDWFSLQTQYALVLEKPEPCQDLLAFCLDSGGCLSEGLARRVVAQLVQALLHCTKRGVLHRDVKPENILIHTDTHTIKLFDFGCGDQWKSTAYKDYAGTLDYTPPEWFLQGKYHAGPATVWSVGVTLYSIVSGSLPFNSPRQIIKGRLRFDNDLSQECRDLICWCLSPKAADRPSLKQIELHPWLH